MVYVSDVNDNIPVFQSSTFSRTLSESLPVDTKILNLVATDADFGNNSMTLYSILSEESAATGTSSGGKVISLDLLGAYNSKKNSCV